VKTFIVTAIRFIAVTILYFGSFAVVSGALLSNASEQNAPAEVRMVHLAETATSNFLFGWLLVLIFLVVPENLVGRGQYRPR
jgi:hypothetical protein